MFYLYDQDRLNALRNTPDQATLLACFCDRIPITNKTDKVIYLAHYPKSAFLIHPKNIFLLFDFWKYQIRHRIMDELRIILCVSPKNLLYRSLSLALRISFDTYHLIPFNHKESR